VNNTKSLALLLISALFFSGCGSQATPTVVEQATAPAATPPFAGTPVQLLAASVTSPQLTSIYFVSLLEGWGQTDTGIVRTNDGGATWRDVTPAGLSMANGVGADFLDASHAWLQVLDPNNVPKGGTLYRTTDGGNTWESFATPFSDGVMKFLDLSNGWIMADLGVGAGSMAIAVFQTTDGGQTWEQIFANDSVPEGTEPSIPLSGIKNEFVPLNMETAWIGGVIYETGAIYLFRTDDAGKDWTKIDLNLPDDALNSELAVADVKFISSTQGILAVRLTATDPEILIFLTNDGGVTWTLAPQRLAGLGILEIPSAREMIFYTNDQFYVSKDRANTFDVAISDISFGDSIVGMSFADASTGWVITQDLSDHRSLYKTSDGGATWSAIIP